MSGQRSEWLQSPSLQKNLFQQQPNREASFPINTQEDMQNFQNYLQNYHKKHISRKEFKENNQQQHQFFESSKKYFFSALPFVIFILIKTGLKHKTGIILFLSLHATFAHCNYMARSVMAARRLKERKKRLLDAVFVSSILILNIILLSVVFSKQKLYRSFYLMPISMEMTDVWSLVWVLILNDFTVMFATILLKIVICLCVPSPLIFHKHKGECYQLIEYLSQSYRRLVPIVPWLCFLWAGDQASLSLWLSIILIVAYVVFKSLDLYSNFKQLKAVVLLFVFSQRPGRRISSSNATSSLCPICHHAFLVPVTAECGDTFCEECLLQWMDREEVCAICAQRLHQHASWRDGQTSTLNQFF